MESSPLTPTPVSPSSTPPKRFDNDTANAELFAKLCADTYKYTVSHGWIEWTGKCWSRVSIKDVCLAAGAVGDYLEAQAVHVQGELEQKGLRNWANASKNKVRLKSMVDLATALLSVDPSELDSQDYLLNLQNGTYDLKRGELRPHDPNDLLTVCAPITYDPNAACPRWLRFQEEVANGDRDLVNFKQRMFGYALSGGIEAQKLFVMYGNGSNGKSTELQVIQALLGDYAAETGFDTFLDTSGSLPALSSLACLQGKRFVSASEPERGTYFKESRLKALTGGEAIVVKFYKKDTFTYSPKFKLFLSVNDLPQIRGTDEGIWRRLVIIPYDRFFSEAERDPYLLETLRAELSGILNWLLEGYRLYLAGGLGTCAAVEQLTRSYRRDQNVIQQFVDEACEIGTSFEVRSSELFEAYTKWHQENQPNDKMLSMRAFGDRLVKLGHDVRARRDGNYRRGLQLKAERE